MIYKYLSSINKIKLITLIFSMEDKRWKIESGLNQEGCQETTDVQFIKAIAAKAKVGCMNYIHDLKVVAIQQG